jgi:hypothetical protein
MRARAQRRFSYSLDCSVIIILNGNRDILFPSIPWKQQDHGITITHHISHTHRFDATPHCYSNSFCDTKHQRRSNESNTRRAEDGVSLLFYISYSYLHSHRWTGRFGIVVSTYIDGCGQVLHGLFWGCFDETGTISGYYLVFIVHFLWIAFSASFLFHGDNDPVEISEPPVTHDTPSKAECAFHGSFVIVTIKTRNVSQLVSNNVSYLRVSRLYHISADRGDVYVEWGHVVRSKGYDNIQYVQVRQKPL